jgi:hypothetical protein
MFRCDLSATLPCPVFDRRFTCVPDGGARQSLYFWVLLYNAADRLRGFYSVWWLQAVLPVPCCADTAVAVEVSICGGSSVRTLITLLTESGDDTPLESLSMSSVSGLKSSSDKRRGRGRAKGSGRPRTIADDRRTRGKGLLSDPTPAIRSRQLKCHCACETLNF